MKMRLLSAQAAKLVAESRDKVEVAEKIVGLYMNHAGPMEVNKDSLEAREGALVHQEVPWKPALGSVGEKNKAHKVRFFTNTTIFCLLLYVFLIITWYMSLIFFLLFKTK